MRGFFLAPLFLVWLPSAARADAGKDLYEAVKAGNVARVEQALARGADPNYRFRHIEETALMRAADGGSSQVVEALLRAGADPNLLDSLGSTALGWAVRAKQAAAVEALLRHKADPNLGQFDRPLCRAFDDSFWPGVSMLARYGAKCDSGPAAEKLVGHVMASGNLSILDEVLARGALDVNGRIGFGAEHLLQVAAAKGSLPLVTLLLRYKASPDVGAPERRTPLMLAEGSDGAEIARQLLGAGAGLNLRTQDGETALACALARKRREVAVVLLAAGATPTGVCERKTPLAGAAEMGDLEIMGRLVERGARPDADALNAAGLGGQVEATRWLLDRGALAKKSERTPVWGAAQSGSVAVVRLLLDHGAEPGNSLQAAALEGHVEVVRLLLARGAKADGESLCNAAARGHAAIIDLLVAAGVDVESKDGFGQSALVVAAMGNQGASIDRLAAAGARIDQTDGDGRTPLMRAVENGSPQATARLLAAGAVVNRTDRDGYTALDHAMRVDPVFRRGVDKVLSSHGGRCEKHTFGMETDRLLWDIGVITFSIAYLGGAIYLQQKTYGGRTEDNPFRWVSYGLLVGAGTTVFGLSLRPVTGSDPYGAAGIARAMAMLVSGAFTIAYGALGLWQRNSPYAYYASAGLVAGLPLLSLRF
jgi:ankyrin repeat protein